MLAGWTARSGPGRPAVTRGQLAILLAATAVATVTGEPLLLPVPVVAGAALPPLDPRLLVAVTTTYVTWIGAPIVFAVDGRGPVALTAGVVPVVAGGLIAWRSLRHLAQG